MESEKSKFKEPGCVEEAKERQLELRDIDSQISASLASECTEEPMTPEEYSEWRTRAIVKRKYVCQELRYLKRWLEKHEDNEILDRVIRIEGKLDLLLSVLAKSNEANQKANSDE